jgi:hypothetical protein
MAHQDEAFSVSTMQPCGHVPQTPSSRTNPMGGHELASLHSHHLPYGSTLMREVTPSVGNDGVAMSCTATRRVSVLHFLTSLFALGKAPACCCLSRFGQKTASCSLLDCDKEDLLCMIQCRPADTYRRAHPGRRVPSCTLLASLHSSSLHRSNLM